MDIIKKLTRNKIDIVINDSIVTVLQMILDKSCIFWKKKFSNRVNIRWDMGRCHDDNDNTYDPPLDHKLTARRARR